MTEYSSVEAFREEWSLLYIASAILRKESDRALAKWNVTIPQAIVLTRFINDPEPIPTSALARFLLQESPSVTTLVDRMCERGLLERTHDPKDRRKAMIAPTAKGHELRRSIQRAWCEVHAELWGGLSREERGLFRDLLRKFSINNIGRLDYS
jgi:DNA-binding MarR family transcriptional regulator